MATDCNDLVPKEVDLSLTLALTMTQSPSLTLASSLTLALLGGGAVSGPHRGILTLSPSLALSLISILAERLFIQA